MNCLSSGASNSRGDFALFDVDTGPEPILLSSFLSVIQTQLTNVPILRIGLRGRTNRLHDLLQSLRSSRGPKTNGLRREVNLVGEVVPCASHEVSRPLRLAVCQPAESLLVAAVLELGEMALNPLLAYAIHRAT
ncbi:unnamed protein product [Aspergillus oryzae RIB40]|uniref:DNA, SC012 n=1 Tax=Aspergillus oryzae (strain ATCC 42149 / RIB 40) TaxID=510516 RepID=Q2UD77_ASPOR|nr:unnamed protein product [Aspergillus oryzae RIB40]BAE60488.1 unnamed protein product [Aspergillus oryzae RIB40]